jgi:RNA polymerase sigma-70 factor (ECF subfamily)
MHHGDKPDPGKLLCEARRHGGEALGRLLELYRNYLNLVARTQIDLHLQAQVSPSDLVQETFLEAYRDFAQFQGNTEAGLVAWLRRILVHNLGRLVQRQVLAQKRTVRREVALGQQLADLERSAARVEAALVSPFSSPSAQAQRRELAAVLADQLARLQPDSREVIVLRNLEGLPFEEVARRMGRSAGAVRVLWMRALDRLRLLLKEEDLI